MDDVLYLPGRGRMQNSLTLSFPAPPARRDVRGVGRETEETEEEEEEEERAGMR